MINRSISLSIAEAQERWQEEVSRGERFCFGRNWQYFLEGLTEESIRACEASLTAWLHSDRLDGCRFLDIGCGSGIFSLAARRLGAIVHSFDYDPDAVKCAIELRNRYFTHDHGWTIEEGNILDRDFTEKLGPYDVVYAWGVLHHTGDLWRALAYAAIPVRRGGKLIVAVYNDQGRKSKAWVSIKRFYNKGPVGKGIAISSFVPYWILRGLAVDIVRLTNPLARYRRNSGRGMWLVTDWLDWLGGYPFEVARPDEIFDFYIDRGFRLQRIMTVGGSLGNNQFLFIRE